VLADKQRRPHAMHSDRSATPDAMSRLCAQRHQRKGRESQDSHKMEEQVQDFIVCCAINSEGQLALIK
jgi:hypothetical protein